MFTFAQVAATLAIFAVWGYACYRLGKNHADIARAMLPRPDLSALIQGILPDKKKPPEDESLNPTWQ